MFFSIDGGHTWALKDIISGTPVRDQTLRFASSGNLYAGVLWGGGGLTTINFDILRTNDFSGSNTMTLLARRQNDDQPFIQAATVTSGPGTGDDRIYVGSNDHAPPNIPSTMDYSLNAAIAAATTKTQVLETRVVSRDGFQTRPAIHPNGTVYALYYALIGSPTSCDVVIVRDDNWASGASPFQALIDPGDSKAGLRIVTGINNPFLSLYIGQQRIGGDLSIAVDPNDSAKVYVCWGDLQAGTYTLHVRSSTDSGATWSPADLRTVTNATNPALAVNDKGHLGFLYQLVTGPAAGQRWQTTIEITPNGFASITSHVLANTPAATPPKAFDPYLGDYLYMLAVGESFYGIFCANNTPDKANFPNGVVYQRNADFSSKTLLNVNNISPVAVSIDPFFFSITRVGKLATAIANGGNFGKTCVGTFLDLILTIDNNGSGTLLITNITSSSPDFLVPSVSSYPLELGPGESIEVVLRFQPPAAGAFAAAFTIFSSDPSGPHRVDVKGLGETTRLSLILANSGNFGSVCLGSFTDEPLILNNSSPCPLSITSISSSASQFLPPTVLSYPLSIAAGGSLPVPIRFAPTSLGAVNGTLTVSSSDPAGPHAIAVSGNAPAGKLAVSGSLCFGGVACCCRAERTLTLCNVGDCALSVSSVAFKRKSPYWNLINNPFPAKLHPGSCLGVVIRYKAAEKCPVACELVITSDDPVTPIKTLDVMAYTIWNACECESCRKDGCAKHDCGCGGCADDCCQDEGD